MKIERVKSIPRNKRRAKYGDVYKEVDSLKRGEIVAVRLGSFQEVTNLASCIRSRYAIPLVNGTLTMRTSKYGGEDMSENPTLFVKKG